MEMREHALPRGHVSLIADDGFARQRTLMAIQFGMQRDSEARKLDFSVIRENVGQVGFPGAWRETVEI